jgi:hypothetical protein
MRQGNVSNPFALTPNIGLYPASEGHPWESMAMVDEYLV